MKCHWRFCDMTFCKLSHLILKPDDVLFIHMLAMKAKRLQNIKQFVWINPAIKLESPSLSELESSC